MNKFSILNENHDTVEKSTTIDEVIINLVKETLNYKITETNKNDILKLVESVKGLIEVQKSKKTIELLEAVRIKSIRHFDMNWINGVIDNEKEILENNSYEIKQDDNFDINTFVEIDIDEHKEVEVVKENNHNCPNCNEDDANCICDDEDDDLTDLDVEQDDLQDIKEIEDEEGFDNNNEEEFNDTFLTKGIKESIKDYQDYPIEESKEEDEKLTKDDTFIDVNEDDETEEEEEEENKDEFEEDIEEYETPEDDKNESKRERIMKFDDFK